MAKRINMHNLKATGLLTFISSGADFEGSIRFYSEIGFSLDFKGTEVAGMSIDGYRFLLQRYHSEWMHGHMMMVLEVENVDDWWQKLSSLGLETRYPGVFIKPPKNFPWGKREIHMGDPNGILWHIASDIPAST